MNIKEYEDFVKKEITDVIEEIIKKKKTLNISAKSRSGAEISDWLEKEFEKSTQNHQFIVDIETAPKGSTKNPWDARCFFNYSNHKEEIWIDFKTFKLSGKDSNPDMGTSNKVIKFIEEGSFYILYIYVFYEEHENGLRFIMSGNQTVKSYFLKDISPTFRITPAKQIQVNISASSTYRTREEFVDLFMVKVRESSERKLKKAQLELAEIDRTTQSLKSKNSNSEKAIEEKIL